MLGKLFLVIFKSYHTSIRLFSLTLLQTTRMNIVPLPFSVFLFLLTATGLAGNLRFIYCNYKQNNLHSKCIFQIIIRWSQSNYLFWWHWYTVSDASSNFVIWFGSLFPEINTSYDNSSVFPYFCQVFSGNSTNSCIMPSIYRRTSCGCKLRECNIVLSSRIRNHYSHFQP